MKTVTTIVARLLYAIPFFVFGSFHILKANAMAGMVPSFFPGGVLWVYITGLGFILAAISIIIQVQTRLACLLLAAELLIFVLAIHLPNLLGGGPMAQMSMGGLLKDTALAGAALAFAGIYNNK
jgi:putative oxidoreductase